MCSATLILFQALMVMIAIITGLSSLRHQLYGLVVQIIAKTRLTDAATDSLKAFVQKDINDRIANAADKFPKSRLSTIDTFSRGLSIAGLPISWKSSSWDESKGGSTF